MGKLHSYGLMSLTKLFIVFLVEFSQIAEGSYAESNHSNLIITHARPNAAQRPIRHHCGYHGDRSLQSQVLMTSRLHLNHRLVNTSIKSCLLCMSLKRYL